MKDLSDYRKSYEKSELLETSIPEDPINLFNRWFHEVEDFGGNEEVNAMTVATIGLDGFPKSRVVLLKKFNEEGFIFYTNYNSEKARLLLLILMFVFRSFGQVWSVKLLSKGLLKKQLKLFLIIILLLDQTGVN